MLFSQQPVIAGFVPESSRAGLSFKMDDVKDVKQDGHGWTHRAHELSSSVPAGLGLRLKLRSTHASPGCASHRLPKARFTYSL